MAGKNAPEPKQLDREAAIIELRRSGATWDKIAKAVGYSNASGAYKAYQRAARRTITPKIEELRAMELDRLDRLQLGIWERAKEGEIRAVDAVLRILDRRARLLGLDAPQKIQAEVITYDGAVLEEHTARIIDLVRQSRGSSGNMGGGISETRAITQ